MFHQNLFVRVFWGRRRDDVSKIKHSGFASVRGFGIHIDSVKSGSWLAPDQIVLMSAFFPAI